MPHVQAKVGYNILDNVRATVGYDFLYWSSVARVGDQIDRQVNDNQQLSGGLGGGPALPAASRDRVWSARCDVTQ